MINAWALFVFENDFVVSDREGDILGPGAVSEPLSDSQPSFESAVGQCDNFHRLSCRL